MPGTCPRCGGERGDGRWCAACGLDSTPTAPTLPTAEAIDAGARERDFFAANPEREAEGEAMQEAARQKREDARLRATRPKQFDEYVHPGWNTRAACAAVIVVSAVALVDLALGIAHLSILGGESATTWATSNRVDASSERLDAVYLAEVLLYVIASAFFIAWTWRTYANAWALGAQGQRFGNGWAIGGWFVPILAFWRPKQIVNDAWRATDADDPATVREVVWRERPVPFVLTGWWILFLAAAMLNYYAHLDSPDTLSGDRTATAIAVAGSLCRIGSGVLAVMMITRLSLRQRERAVKVAELPPYAPPQAV